MHVPDCTKKAACWVRAVYKNIWHAIALCSLPFNQRAKYINASPVQFHTRELITYVNQNFKFSERKTAQSKIFPFWPTLVETGDTLTLQKWATCDLVTMAKELWKNVNPAKNATSLRSKDGLSSITDWLLSEMPQSYGWARTKTWKLLPLETTT